MKIRNLIIFNGIVLLGIYVIKKNKTKLYERNYTKIHTVHLDNNESNETRKYIKIKND